jgi:hypothetical protein
MGLITTTGSGNWSSTTPDAPWPSGTKPTTGDVVEIAAGHTVTLDENTAVLGAAGIKNVAGSNTSVLNINGTVTINGNVSYSGTASTGFVTYGTGDALTILGTVTNSGTGRAVVGSGSGTLNAENLGNIAATCSAGISLDHNSTGDLTIVGKLSGNASSTTGILYVEGACTWTLSNGGDAVIETSGGSAFRANSGTGTITGACTNSSKTFNEYWINIAGSAVTINGTIESEGTQVRLTSGTLFWTGSRTHAAGKNVHFYLIGGTLNIASLVLANSGSVIIQYSTGTITVGSGGTLASITNQSEVAGVACIDYDASAIVHGPTLPAEEDVEDGVAYGYAGAPLEGTLAAGYTYGDESQAKVLTTATGAGTYQPVAAADVQEGVAVGVSPAVGTFVVPAEADVELAVEYGDSAEFVGELVVGGGVSSGIVESGFVR